MIAGVDGSRKAFSAKYRTAEPTGETSEKRKPPLKSGLPQELESNPSPILSKNWTTRRNVSCGKSKKRGKTFHIYYRKKLTPALYAPP